MAAHEGLRSDISSKAQEILREKMPAKIMVMHELLQSIGEVDRERFNSELVSFLGGVALQCRVALGTKRSHSDAVGDGDVHVGKKRKTSEDGGSASSTSGEGAEAESTLIDRCIPNVVIPPNKEIMDIIARLKKEVLEEIELLNTVKIWIQLNVPRIEDGNNFGVGIQEEMINELARAENDAIAVLDSITKYYISRGKILSKVIKYPTLGDYRQSVVELDEKELENLRMCVLDIRNTYAILYDLINKNKDKIERPRSSHHQSLY